MINLKLLKRNRLLDMTPEEARPATLLKKRLWHSCFAANFVKFSRTPFSQSTSGRLPLWLIKYEILTARIFLKPYAPLRQKISVHIVQYRIMKRREKLYGIMWTWPKNSVMWIYIYIYLKCNIRTYLILKPGKKFYVVCLLLHFKKDENALKSSFHSQDIQGFIVTFWSCRKNDLIRKIRLISKFTTSQPS